jgi:hypothetical protein
MLFKSRPKASALVLYYYQYISRTATRGVALRLADQVVGNWQRGKRSRRAEAIRPRYDVLKN